MDFGSALVDASSKPRFIARKSIYGIKWKRIDIGENRSDGVSGGENMGLLGEDGVVKGRTMVVSKRAMESECVGVGRSSS